MKAASEMKTAAVLGAGTMGAGIAQVCAQAIKRVDSVDWMDLGSPEAIWHLWVEDFQVPGEAPKGRNGLRCWSNAGR